MKITLAALAAIALAIRWLAKDDPIWHSHARLVFDGEEWHSEARRP